MKINVEYTDTYAGEANYSWVERAEIDVPDDASDRLIMCRAKAVMGLSGVRGRTYHYGDMSEFRPYRCCTVLFVG